MADDNTIIEGTVKFRDGRKWKSRWCVMRRLSPVADCVQLQLYRSARGRAGGAGGAGGAGSRQGECRAALSLQQFVGAESGFTLDKHSNTLALVCRDLVAVLAFDTRERLIQWQVKVSAALGESRQHVVVVKGGALAHGPARLHVLHSRAALTAGAPPKLLGLWEIQHLRRYGVVDGRFCLEGGSLCGKGEGLHVLVSDRPHDLARDFELAALGRLSPRRRPLAPKAIERVESPSPDWCGAAEAGAGDTASVRGVGAAGGGGAALERCMSCMSKLGALSRSSTAALTPGAKHFSPAWTMEALSEPHEKAETDSVRSPTRNEVTPHVREVCSPPPERPSRPVRLDLPRGCTCDHILDDGEVSGIGPYENYDVPRVPSFEVEGEYYDTPKRLRECVDGELFQITRSSTANTLILKKPCGCLLRFGKKRREPTIVDADEDLRPPACPCQKVTDWANNWIKLPYCRRNTASSEPSASDKENITPDASALYATIDFSRKTRRKTCGDEPVEIDTGPLAHYENLNFALSLEYYENAKDMLRKAGVTQTELNAISSNLKPARFASTIPRRECKKCGHPPRSARTDNNDEYLMMEPNNIESNKLEQSRAPPSGYTPMSPIGGFAFHTLKHPNKSPIIRLLEEKSASNPTLCAGEGVGGARRGSGRGGGRPRSSSADSSRFLDDVKEFDGSAGGSASSLETLRDVPVNGVAHDGKLSDVDSSEASKSHETKPRTPKMPVMNGNRDSSSSNDSGVSSWSLRAAAGEFSRPRCRDGRRGRGGAGSGLSSRAPRPRSSDAPRAAPPPDQPKSSSAEAEVPLLCLRPLRGVRVMAGGDSRSTSSGASDMSDYIETLSLCSSHSSSDTPVTVTMRARVTSTLRPRSGKEYARLSCAGARGGAASGGGHKLAPTDPH